MNENINKLNTLINECSTSVGMPQYADDAASIVDSQNINIGFLGAFSSGKTSLINSILKMNLPTDLSATTMSICMIEPCEGVEKNQYFRDTGSELEPISISDFYSILGDKGSTSVGVVKTKPSKILPKGTIFIDTPGIDSVGTEIEKTFAFLQNVDASVFCIKSTDGTITNNVLDFLKKPELQSIASHMLFALTYEDQQENPDAVKKEILNCLRSIPAFAKIPSLENRVLYVNAKEGENNDELVYGYVNDYILSEINSIRDARIEKELKKIAVSIQGVLQEKLNNMHLDDSAIFERQKELEEQINALNNKLLESDDILYDFQKELERDLRNQMNGWKPAVATCEGIALKAKTDEMLSNLTAVINSKVRSILPNVTIPEGIAEAASPAIASSLQSIDKYKDFSIMIGTSVLLAWIMPAAGVAGNAGEAAVGAGGKVAASEMAKVGAQAGATAAKAAEASTVAKVLGVVGNIIKEANPLEHIGSMVSTKIKESSFTSLAANYASSIALNVTNSIKNDFAAYVVGPIMQDLEAKQKNLAEEEEKRSKGYAQFKEEKVFLAEMIKKLDSFA